MTSAASLPDPNVSSPLDASGASDMLQMSVHSLPAPVEPPAERTRLGRLKMFLVMAVCAAPVVASYFTFYVVRPQSRTNYGTLITPPVPLPDDAALSLQTLRGAPVKAASLKGQWLLVTVAGGDCDARCERQLYLQRQIREALGKEMDRVDRVWLIDDQRPMRPALDHAMKDATVLRVDAGQLGHWLAPQAGQSLASHWYLVDPRGQWMMRFPPEAEPRQVLKDLTKLLKASAFWDTAGRP